jgi:hypothetical protein
MIPADAREISLPEMPVSGVITSSSRHIAAHHICHMQTVSPFEQGGSA